MNRAEAFKLVWTHPLGVRVALWSKLPLAAFAGLRVLRLDESGAEVKLPAGWKTQNPFGSTYFAAQAMAAEMSTGAPALWMIEKSGAKVSSLVTGLSARFTKKAVKEARFVFSEAAAMRAWVMPLSDEERRILDGQRQANLKRVKAPPRPWDRDR